jgi:hypothetical protein
MGINNDYTFSLIYSNEFTNIILKNNDLLHRLIENLIF